MTDRALPTRPMLKPAVRLLWRDQHTLQLGVSARRATMLRDVTPGERATLPLLDGTRDIDAIVADAADVGLSRADVTALLHSLVAAGALDDAAVPLPAVSETQRQQLEPDLFAASLLHHAPGAAAQLLARRTTAYVDVHGGSRVGASLTMLLNAAGIGAVTCHDDAPLRPADIAPGGVREFRVMTRGDAVRASVDTFNAQTRRGVADAVATKKKRRPSRETSAATPMPTLAVVTSVGGFPPTEVVAAVRDRPHLFVDVCETTAAIGPFVLPGTTPCLRCLQLSRGDRDGRWPMVAAQLVSRRVGVDACDVTIATLAASLAAMHVLRWIDAADADVVSTIDSAGGVLEFDLADRRLRRRSVPAHPGCGCGAGDGQAVIARPGAMSRSLSA
jgi:bacteriocin biosynthesis cyclodehydratase domain-containing protein